MPDTNMDAYRIPAVDQTEMLRAEASRVLPNDDSHALFAPEILRLLDEVDRLRKDNAYLANAVALLQMGPKDAV